MDANEKLQKLLEFHGQMDGKNYFELLGVPEDADDAGVRSAYFGLLKNFNADYFHQVESPEDKQAVEDVNRQLRQAYDALMKEEGRKAYLAKLKGEAPEAGAEEVNIEAIFEADQALAQAENLMERGDFKVAIPKLEKAISLDSKLIEAELRLAYSKFMLLDVDENGKRDPSVVSETRKKLVDGCKTLEHADYLRLYLGVLEKLEGNSAEALKWFKEAVKINPENMSAKREIRMATGEIPDPMLEAKKAAAEKKKKNANGPQKKWLQDTEDDHSVLGRIKWFLAKLDSIKLF